MCVRVFVGCVCVHVHVRCERHVYGHACTCMRLYACLRACCWLYVLRPCVCMCMCACVFGHTRLRWPASNLVSHTRQPGAAIIATHATSTVTDEEDVEGAESREHKRWIER
jgi:hypothetical protein